MGKHLFLALIIAGHAGLADQAGAHVGDRRFSLFELADEDLAQIDLYDGSADDWRDVLGEPSLTASEFFIAGVPVNEEFRGTHIPALKKRGAVVEE